MAASQRVVIEFEGCLGTSIVIDARSIAGAQHVKAGDPG